MRAFVFAVMAIGIIGKAVGGDLQVQKVPNELTENGFVLEVQFSAERKEYMSPSTSITKIRGFRDRKTCWDNAAAIAKTIREAAKNAKNIGRESFSCNPETDFKRLSGEVNKPTKANRDRKAEALAELLSN
ncbi:MAG: hypothetical protein VCA39_02635 [Pseudomonas sp.]|uniref:hypothetical protein n=1 Tax=Pseudomonas sp. TaxID=306 RepID=UPI003981A921